MHVHYAVQSTYDTLTEYDCDINLLASHIQHFGTQ